MAWFARARRGFSWKDQTLDSISAPPLPLMVFFGLLMMMVYFASNWEHKERLERKKSGFRFGLLLLPMVVVIALNLVMLRRRMLRYSFGVPRPIVHAAAEEAEGGSAAGLLLVLLLLVVMVHYHSSTQSSWFRFI